MIIRVACLTNKVGWKLVVVHGDDSDQEILLVSWCVTANGVFQGISIFLEIPLLNVGKVLLKIKGNNTISEQESRLGLFKLKMTYLRVGHNHANQVFVVGSGTIHTFVENLSIVVKPVQGSLDYNNTKMLIILAGRAYMQEITMYLPMARRALQ